MLQEDVTDNLNVFGWFFYILLGFIDGALNGFPDSTKMGDCNDNISDIRVDFEEGMEYYNDDDIESGAASY